MKKFYDIYKNYEKIDIPELIYNDKYFINTIHYYNYGYYSYYYIK